MIEIILASLSVMLASLIGIVSVWKHAGNIIEKNLHFLVSFSAGVFLVICYGIILETFHHSENPSAALFWIISGMFLVWLLFKIIPAFHHHHDEECHDHNHHKMDYRKIVLGDAFHNIGDGILLAASFSVSSVLGFTATLSIVIHELIQEVSEFFVLKGAGLSTKKALGINFLTSATVLIGSVGGFFLLGTFEVLEVPLLGLSAGVFLIMILQDLIPHSIKDGISKRHLMKHVWWFLLGLVLMFVVSSFFGHE